MKKIIILLLIGFLFTSCDRLSTIPYCCPQQTPVTWCDSVPCAEIKLGTVDFVLAKPSSSFIVYFLGLLTVTLGIYFLRIRKKRKSLYWWGLSMLFWGTGALLAGTSYQAFSYEIKCRGLEICSWTSWWEIWYLIFSTLSIDAMIVAFAYSCVNSRFRKFFTGYAAFNAVVYTGITLVGAFIPDQFMVSFELMILFVLPSFILFLLINLGNYIKNKGLVDLVMIGAWCWLAFTMVAYYAYFLAGITESLWKKGFWFSQNDVLHIGLIIWMIYLGVIIPKLEK